MTDSKPKRRSKTATSKPAPVTDEERVLQLAETLQCPPELSPVARKEWDRIVADLSAKGVLSKFDFPMLAIYCAAYALWLDALEGVQQFGAMIKSPNGYPQQSPYLSMVNKQAEIMSRIASEFGFTPAARSRSFSYDKSNSMLLQVRKRDDDLEPLG